jgi:hypothetical protein
LPLLWENLSVWLSSGTNPDRYRKLSLPNPGGLTRIGYTVKLAFPDRRDQRHLFEILDTAAAFEEFRRLFGAPSTRSSMRLSEHRFWAAVRDAALRGRGADQAPELRARVQLLCEEQEDRLAAFVVADEVITDVAVVHGAELPVGYGPWRYALLTGDAKAVEVSALEATLRALLEGRLRLPWLSALVEQGILPFVESPYGLLELASKDNLESARVMLARRDLADDLVRLFGRTNTRVNDSGYEGWVQIHEVQIRALPSEQLEETTLRRCWMLHESLVLMSIRLVGGVRADDGWLGFREVLPQIAVTDAISVALEDPSSKWATRKIKANRRIRAYTSAIMADAVGAKIAKKALLNWRNRKNDE